MSPILPPTQGQIDSILDSLGYFANQGTVGYAVGVVTPDFEQIFFSGAMNDYSGNPLPFDEDIPFELASVSKVFPAALLTQLALKDPTLFSRSITSCVPAGFASLPSSFDPITLLNLTNYTSGLPWDGNTPPSDAPATPPVPYSAPSMYGYLHDGWVPVVGTGTTFTYSSLAPSLLAQALPVAVGSDLSFGELLAEEITGPLGMTSTVPFEDISFTRFPLPMSGGAPATNGWNLLPAFTGGSGLVSTSSDMMIWLKFNMGLMPESPLNAILARMQTASTSVPYGGGTVGIGWFLDAITATSGDAAITPIPIVYKAGLITSSSFICFMQSPDPGAAPSPAGVFLLSNDAAYGGPGSLFTSGAACVLQLLLAMNGYPNATSVNLL